MSNTHIGYFSSFKIDTWSHLHKRGIINCMDLPKGAATAKVEDKRHRLRELICASGDLPALHAAPEVLCPTAPQQNQDIHGNSEISAPCQIEATILSFPKEERHEEHRCCQYFL
ncbi:hypothetical protein BaRGS_00002868 [Batillaria attramentaria]|uniref:Uncharacterized protein n=1 Tax=Batillaria attramentaria TaxID=370345 RepID=A0ABD0M491_9CAEN